MELPKKFTKTLLLKLPKESQKIPRIHKDISKGLLKKYEENISEGIS